jgi:hypothetical protein
VTIRNLLITSIDGMDGPTEVGGMEELVMAVKEENPEIT